MNQISKPPAPAQMQSVPPEITAPSLAPARQRLARRLGWGVVLLLALALAVGAWAHFAAREAAHAAMVARQNAVPQVRILRVQPSLKPQIVDLPATLQAYDAATIAARATGYIAARNVDIGSRVHKGDVLAVIAAPDLDQQLAQARAQLMQMQAAFLQAEASRSLAHITNQRTQRLVKEGWDSKQQGDQDSTAARTQAAAVAVAQANIAAQQAQVNRLAELTGFEKVLAPFDGVITARSIDIGSLVTADAVSGTSLFSIARTDILRAQLYVPQEYVFGVKDGQDTTVSVPQLPGAVFAATLSRNAHALAAGTRTLLAEADVDNRDGKLTSGLYAIVHLAVPRTTPVFEVPSQAVIFDQSGLSVAVMQDGAIKLHHLDVAEDNGANLMIRGGLSANDAVILNPPVDAADDMRVEAK